METIKKEQEIPEEIHDLFAKAIAARDCRDIAIQKVFRAKRAIYYQQQYNELTKAAWKLLFELYPNLRPQQATMVYDPNSRELLPIAESRP